MNFDEKYQFIFSAFNLKKSPAYWAILPSDKIIEKIQSFLDRNIIELEDLYAFLIGTKFCTGDDKVVWWMIDQVKHILEMKDIRRIIRTFYNVIAFQTQIKELCGDKQEDISPEDVDDPSHIYGIFGPDRTAEYLDDMDIDDVITQTHPSYICAPDVPSSVFLCDYIKNRIDELSDVSDISTLYEAMDIIEYSDSIDRCFESHISQNKYAILQNIILDIHPSDLNENKISEQNQHVISIYERVVGEPVIIGNDRYSAYFVGFKFLFCQDSYDIKCVPTSFALALQKARLFVHNNKLEWVLASAVKDEYVQLRQRIIIVKQKYNNHSLDDMSVIETDIDEFNQLLPDIADFMCRLMLL